MEKNSLELNDILSDINNSHYILILTHKDSDLDTISCALALSNYMYENKIKHKIFNSSTTLPRVLRFLPKFDKITHQIPKYYDLVINLNDTDSSTTIINKEIKSIDIYFNKANNILEFLDINNLTISKNIAICLYVAIYCDTLGFTSVNTTQKTFNIVTKLLQIGISPHNIATNLLQKDTLAKYRILPKILDTLDLSQEGKVATIYLQNSWLKQTGATIRESKEAIDMVLKIAIVDVVAYFMLIDSKVEISLKSKDGYDISNILHNFDTTTHKNIVSFFIETDSISIAKQKFLDFIKL